jgi:hypothetical protein
MLELESFTLDVQTLQRYREEHKQDCLDSSNSGKNNFVSIQNNLTTSKPILRDCLQHKK